MCNAVCRPEMRLAPAWVVVACPQSSSPAAQVEAPPGRGIGTRILHPENHPVHDPYGAVSPPLYQTATFGQPGATEGGPYDYTRSGNPTRTQLESQMAELEVCSCQCAQSSTTLCITGQLTIVVSYDGVALYPSEESSTTSRCTITTLSFAWHCQPASVLGIGHSTVHCESQTLKNGTLPCCDDAC
jgi:Cys/Met metabolism PLP-dependent enzyme